MATDAEQPTSGIALALSGGGFRASFFHIGVLRRLAELGLLEQVRVISCVSGGSIAGAVYYLSLVERLLLPGKKLIPDEPPQLRDDPLTTAEYAACVAKTREVLTTIARSNVRATMFRNPWKNATMFVSPHYSRTDRAGDMLDRHLRRGFGLDTGFRHFRVANQIELRLLHHVRGDLPRLVLNATTLNTGHAWRFDTDGMGELLSPSRRVVDKNALLRWTSYEELAALGSPQHNFPYGLAVAASAAFPGLFRPLPVSGIYPGYRVDLMDGGAQDNQGIQSLLGERPASMGAVLFDRVIVSDGAAQMADEQTKRRSFIAVQRVLGIQGDRIREEQLLSGIASFQPPRRLVLLDLRHGLPYADVPAGPAAPAPPPASDFGLAVRERLAGLRTDLDAFGALETELLERRGYQVAAAGLEQQPPPTPGPPLTLSPERTLEVLDAARRQLLKPFAVFGAATLVLVLVAGALVALAAWSLELLAPDPTWRLVVRVLLLGVFLFLPAIVTRLLLAVPVRWPRRAKWLGAGAVYALLWLGAVFAGPAIDHWGGADWSRTEAGAIGAALLAAPAVLPAVAWLLLWLEGLWWRSLARLPSS